MIRKIVRIGPQTVKNPQTYSSWVTPNFQIQKLPSGDRDWSRSIPISQRFVLSLESDLIERPWIVLRSVRGHIGTWDKNFTFSLPLLAGGRFVENNQIEHLVCKNWLKSTSPPIASRGLWALGSVATRSLSTDMTSDVQGGQWGLRYGDTKKWPIPLVLQISKLGWAQAHPKQKHTDLTPFQNRLFRKLGGGQEEIFSLWPRTYWIHFQGCWKCSDCKDNTWGCMRDEIRVNLCHLMAFWNFIDNRSKVERKKSPWLVNWLSETMLFAVITSYNSMQLLPIDTSALSSVLP